MVRMRREALEQAFQRLLRKSLVGKHDLAPLIDAAERSIKQFEEQEGLVPQYEVLVSTSNPTYFGVFEAWRVPQAIRTGLWRGIVGEEGLNSSSTGKP